MRNGARTIGAAAVILNSQEEIVLVRLSYRTGWGVPGGFSSRDEQPDATIRREVEEETRILINTVPGRPAVKLDGYHRHLSFIYLIRSDVEPKRPQRLLRRLEIREVRRFPLSALPTLYEGTAELIAAALDDSQ